MKYILLLLLGLLSSAGCSYKIQNEIRPDFKAYFDEYHVDGSFHLFLIF